jgi:hypothetical protein
MFLEFYDTGSGGIVKGSSSLIFASYQKVRYSCEGGSVHFDGGRKS